jgi:L-serine dehydratase
VELFGSLGIHRQGPRQRQGRAAGPEGEDPETVDVDRSGPRSRRSATRLLRLPARHPIRFEPSASDRVPPPREAAAALRTACGSRPSARPAGAARARVLLGRRRLRRRRERPRRSVADTTPRPPSPTRSPAPSCSRVPRRDRPVDQHAHAGERARLAQRGRPARRPAAHRAVMEAVRARGCEREGILPGGLKVRAAPPPCTGKPEGRPARPAARSARSSWTGSTCSRSRSTRRTPPAGGSSPRPPTAPPASSPRCCCTTSRFVPGARRGRRVRFLLTAARDRHRCTRRTPRISGAEVGCQGEVGVACSMAAGGPRRGPGRHAGAGRERRRDRHGAQPRASPATRSAAWSRCRASSATRWGRSRRSTPRGWRCAATAPHFVSLDKVIKTMRQTGADMKRWTEVQGDRPRRARREHRRVLSASRSSVTRRSSASTTGKTSASRSSSAASGSPARSR